jgi:hypothetical protein
VQCEKCKAEVAEEEIYVHAGSKLCEDCYIVALTRPQPCDPGAVSAARASRELNGYKGSEGLKPRQKQIYDFLKKKGKATHKEISEALNIPMEDLEREFAILRHCELVRGFKEENQIYLTLM